MTDDGGDFLSATHIFKSFGGIKALTDVSFKLKKGERVGLIGPNGSGKTTLLNIISGVFKPDSGRVVFEQTDITTRPAHARTEMGIARTFQVPRPFQTLSLLDNVKIAVMYGSRDHKKTKSGSSRASDTAKNLLKRLGLEPKEQTLPKELTQIDMRKMELARALAVGPKLLLLDEVMAGLTSDEVDEVLKILLSIHEEGITIVMVEHIMRAIMNFCERIVVLSEGRQIASGTTNEIANDREVIRVYLGE